MFKLQEWTSLPVILVVAFLQLLLSLGSSVEVLAIAPNDFRADSTLEERGDLKGKLIFAQVLYRHGDRMPIDPYPNDPWKDRQYWPNGWGQLTNLGKMQHYNLGQWLRKRYGALLSRDYTENEIYVRSTDVDRTLMSALANLAGLYPPEGDHIWNSGIAWQPIPVHTVPEKLDNNLMGKAPCPAYEYELSALLNSPEFQKLNDHYAYLYDYLSKNTGLVVDSLESVQRINNTFYIEELYNRTLPDWTHLVYPSSDMEFIANFAFAVATYTRSMARLKAGPLIKEMLERFASKAKGTLDPDRSLWVYSAHDTTVANLLNTLKLFDLHSPPYIACIMMELRIDDKYNPFVSIFYKNTTADPLPMFIPDCGTACPLDKMFTLYRDILPVDWHSECKLSSVVFDYEEADVGVAMGILVAIISIMLFLSYVVVVYYRRRSYRNYLSYTDVA